MDNFLESTLIMRKINTEILSDFPLFKSMWPRFTNENGVDLVILYNPINKEDNFLASDYLEGRTLIKAWNEILPLERFHRVAKHLRPG